MRIELQISFPRNYLGVQTLSNDETMND